MADVNWTKYRCDLCLMIGLIAAAAVSALVGWLLLRVGVPMTVSVLLFLLAWAVLGYAVDGTCRKKAKAAAAADVGGAEPTKDDEASAKDTAALEAAAAEKAAAEKAAADAAAKEAADKAAAEKATADAAAKAATEKAAAAAAAKAAADKEAADKAAAEAADKAAAEKAEAERVAAEEADKAEAAKASAGDIDRDGDGVIEGKDEGTRPEALTGPRGGQADDLKRIKGIGPKLEILCNELGFYHFDQIAGWTSDEVAWVDSNLEGFRGRVTRDEWVSQARTLSQGDETEFSKRVDDGDVPSSQ